MRYVIADIHGEYEKLVSLVSVLKKDAKEYIFLGDYLDKGKKAKEVIDLLRELSAETPCIFLKGDHEYAWSEYISGNDRFFDFILNYGGKSTLESYLRKSLTIEETRNILSNRDFLIELFGDHLDFIEKMRFYFEVQDSFMCVHAGINPDNFGLPLESHNKEDLVFIRWPFIQSKLFYQGRRVVFGHTAFKECYIDRFKIGIDTGATYYAGNRLTALNIDKLYLIDHDGIRHGTDVDCHPDLIESPKERV